LQTLTSKRRASFERSPISTCNRNPEFQLEMFCNFPTSARQLEFHHHLKAVRPYERVEAQRVRDFLRPVRSQSHVARILGCTRQNIEQVERKALAKIIRRLRAMAREPDLPFLI